MSMAKTTYSRTRALGQITQHCTHGNMTIGEEVNVSKKQKKKIIALLTARVLAARVWRARHVRVPREPHGAGADGGPALGLALGAAAARVGAARLQDAAAERVVAHGADVAWAGGREHRKCERFICCLCFFCVEKYACLPIEHVKNNFEIDSAINLEMEIYSP